jgi:hypothetical protein
MIGSQPRQNVSETASQKQATQWVSMAHTCNPTYLGGRDQEDCVLKPTWVNRFEAYLEKTHH